MVSITKQVGGKPTKNSRKAKNVLDRIAPIDLGEEGVKINIYGRSGTGKTTFWSSFPGKILAIVCSGTQKGELRSIHPSHRKKIEVVNLLDTSEIKQLVEHASDGHYKTVVLDHASGLQDKKLAEILEIDELPEQKSWGMASREQYGQCSLEMKTLLRAILNLSCNVVVIAQERDFNTENDSELLLPYVASALSPAVVGWLNQACDYICQTYIREQQQKVQLTVGGKKKEQLRKTGEFEYCLRTGPSDVFTTKFRVPKGFKLPKLIVDPDYDKFMAVLQGEK